MSVNAHLLEDETILDHCLTDYWAWVVTDRRLLKYRAEQGGGEQLHDISFHEISSTSMIDEGRNDRLGAYGVLAIVSGLIVDLALGMPAMSWVTIPLGGYFIYKWSTSPAAYFQFRGTGLLQEEAERWRIDQTAVDDPDEVREFVKTVRSQL